MFGHRSAGSVPLQSSLTEPTGEFIIDHVQLVWEFVESVVGELQSCSPRNLSKMVTIAIPITNVSLRPLLMFVFHVVYFRGEHD